MEKSLTVMLTVHSNSDYFADCNYAVLTITAPMAQRWLNLMTEVTAMRETRPNFYSLVFWDASVVRYYCSLDIGDTWEDDKVPLSPNQIAEIAQAEPAYGVEVEQLHITNDEIWWDMSPRHTENLTIDTTRIDRLDLEKWLIQLLREE